MPVIHVFGASGSGTSTLGAALQQRFGYTQLDADDYYWLPTDPPFANKRPIAERLGLIRQDIAKNDKVVITGSLCGWGDALIPSFDLLIRLVTPTQTRLARIKARELKRFGARIQPNGDMFAQHQEFLCWAAGYDDGDCSTRSKALHDQWQENITCPQLTLDGTAPADALVDAVAAAFSL